MTRARAKRQREKRRHKHKNQHWEQERAAAEAKLAEETQQTEPTNGVGGIPKGPIETMDCDNRKDVVLMRRAVNERWPINEAVRPAVTNEMSRLAIDPNQDPRTKVAAAKVLVAMDRLNQADEKPAAANQTNVQVNVGVGVEIDNGRDSIVPYLDAIATAVGRTESEIADGNCSPEQLDTVARPNEAEGIPKAS